MRDYITINKDSLPYTFDILLADELFTIDVSYNRVSDSFVLGLKKDGEVICAGEPIVYGVPLWQDVFVAGKYPALTIIPFDESGETTAVTYDNLNNAVKLIIDNGVDSLAERLESN